jgi:hypothetical protein
MIRPIWVWIGLELFKIVGNWELIGIITRVFAELGFIKSWWIDSTQKKARGWTKADWRGNLHENMVLYPQIKGVLANVPFDQFHEKELKVERNGKVNNAGNRSGNCELCDYWWKTWDLNSLMSSILLEPLVDDWPSEKSWGCSHLGIRIHTVKLVD